MEGHGAYSTQYIRSKRSQEVTSLSTLRDQVKETTRRAAAAVPRNKGSVPLAAMCRTRTHLRLKARDTARVMYPHAKIHGPVARGGRAPALICQICRENRFDPTNSTDQPRTGRQVLSLCRAAMRRARSCMGAWLQDHDHGHAASCPVCRLEWRHDICGYHLRARYLTRRAVVDLPRTMPERSWIP
jgi:hypothetical protein